MKNWHLGRSEPHPESKNIMQIFENCSWTKCCSHLAISQRWDSGTAGSRSPANRPTRVRDGEGVHIFQTRLKYVFVSLLRVSLAKGVDTVCRELPLRCRWSYYVWCGRGRGVSKWGCEQICHGTGSTVYSRGSKMPIYLFHPHPRYHHSLPLFLGLSERIRCGERHMTWIAQHEKLHLSRF